MLERLCLYSLQTHQPGQRLGKEHDVLMTVGMHGLERGRHVRQRMYSIQCKSVKPSSPLIRANIHDDTTATGCRRIQRSTRYGTERLYVDDFLRPFISLEFLVSACCYHNNLTTLFAARNALISPAALELSTYVVSTA